MDRRVLHFKPPCSLVLQKALGLTHCQFSLLDPGAAAINPRRGAGVRVIYEPS